MEPRIPILLVLLIALINEKKRECILIPSNKILLKGSGHNKIYNLFIQAVKEYKKFGVNVKISQYDLFHFHKCKNGLLVFHCKEYPNNKKWNLGYCQKNSNVSMLNFNKRNLVFDPKTNIYSLKENTPGLLYYDYFSIIDYYIDPITLKTYYVKINNE